MNVIRRFIATSAVALLMLPSLSADAIVRASTGWITSNGRHVLARCSVYSEWTSDRRIASTSETSSCPGGVTAGMKVNGRYFVGSPQQSLAIMRVSVAGTAHYSGYIKY